MTTQAPAVSATHFVRLSCSETQAHLISDRLSERLDPDDTAIASYEALATTAHWNAVPWIVEAFFGTAPEEAEIRAIVAGCGWPDLADAAIFGTVPREDWVANSLAGLVPVRAGRFLVHGAHSRASVRANDIGLEIEAALAFGTGHHGTTRGCLLMLESVLKRRRPARVLDVGTGSGVLAIAAARVLKGRIAAGDIDPVSVAAARSNAVLNRAGPFVHPVSARGLRHPALQGGGPYDLALANILAKPLRLLAPDLCAAMADGGEIILSGLLARDVNGVVSAYRAQGFKLARRISLEGWASLLMRR